MTGRAVLMGIWSGSWKVDGTQVVFAHTEGTTKSLAAPLGIGVVVPAQKLAELIVSAPLQNLISQMKR